MRLKNIKSFILFTLLLSACKSDVKPEITVIKSENQTDIIIFDNANDIEDKNLKKVPSYISGKLASYSSYEAVTHGETVATVGIKTTQTIDAKAIKSEYSYLINTSESSFVKCYHEAYFYNHEALYKEKESGSLTNVVIDEYLNNFGCYPLDNTLEGYLISEDSIVNVTRVESETENYKFKIIFDNEKSTNNVKIQMKKFGNLGDFPSFSYIEMVVEVTEDFTLISNKLHAEYKAKKLVNTDCVQDYLVTYSNYNENIEVPNLDSVKSLFH